MIKVLFWIAVASSFVYGVFRLTHVKSLQCTRCGEIVSVDEYRMHDFRCKQKN